MRGRACSRGRGARFALGLFGAARLVFALPAAAGREDAATSFRAFTSTIGATAFSSSSGATCSTFSRSSLILGRELPRKLHRARFDMSFDGGSAPSNVNAVVNMGDLPRSSCHRRHKSDARQPAIPLNRRSACSVLQCHGHDILSAAAVLQLAKPRLPPFREQREGIGLAACHGRASPGHPRLHLSMGGNAAARSAPIFRASPLRGAQTYPRAPNLP